MSEENYPGNRETREAIQAAKEADLGASADKKTGIAGAYASLNVAESLQMLQMNIVVTAEKNREVSEKQTEKIIESNNALITSNQKHANRMFWLTLALVFVGVVQAFSALASSSPYILYFLNHPL